MTRSSKRVWPKESLARYYDKERTRIREIIPVEYGVKEGYYYYFYENGNIAVRGEYKDDRKVGEWIEYWPNRGRRKKIIQYREDPYNESFKPYTVKEWAANGSLVFDREAWQREIKAGITRNQESASSNCVICPSPVTEIISKRILPFQFVS